VRRPRARALLPPLLALSLARPGIFQLIFFPRARALWPRVPRWVSTGRWYIPVAPRAADTEAKWLRINQRRPIINELRPRPPRAFALRRGFLSLTSRGSGPWAPVHVITSRWQTVGVSAGGPAGTGPRRGASRGNVVSSRERAMRIRLEGPSPPFAPRGILPPSVARYYFDIGCAVWVFLRYAVTGALRDDTETRRAVPREKGGGGRAKRAKGT